MTRRQARETALKVLFQIDIGKIEVDEAMKFMLAEDDSASEIDVSFLKRLVEGTAANLPEIDRVIAETAVEWKLERMLGTDRNILRLAVFEILFCPDIPESATVNEAVELAKIYGDDHSGKFVNGILGNVIRSGRRVDTPKG
ncbi:MAG TPA: transcription antitermination factor NusB [Firmicutes bacterium]|jgi:N utilization substance protein B|nr:transcription antitermination factor NusB [Bacillota bacterium]HBL67502.1 transcription antitermination factor NusB [Bacillota bacterium]HCT36765.1 transcription antitermination factor NusB [Bacillota bacterium]HCX71107.1 transcription antitermination factor NusB [Bacillota bacterium]